MDNMFDFQHCDFFCGSKTKQKETFKNNINL